MKDITVPGIYTTRDGHTAEVRRFEITPVSKVLTYHGVIMSGRVLPAGRLMTWQSEGRFVGSMAGEEHDLDLVRRA